MATVPSEVTAVAGTFLTAAMWNSNVRDAVNFLIARPLAVMRQTVAQSFANTTWAPLTFDTEDIDRDNGHSTVTNTTRYTAQTPGWYTVHTNVSWAVNATAARLAAWTINGTNFSAKVHLGASPSFETHENTSGMVFLNVSDYLEIQGWQNSGGALSTVIQNNNPRVQILWESS